MSTSTKSPAEDITPPRPRPPPNPKNKPFSSPNEMVTFIVGTEYKQETFMIHKQVACEHSEVWNRAFNSAFIEGQTQTYRIEDADPESFRLLTQWVYQEKFDHAHSRDSSSRHNGDYDLIIQCMEEDGVLLGIWVLAEKYLIRRLQNYTMRVLYSKSLVCNLHLVSNELEYVFHNTGEESALRRFVIEQYCCGKTESFHRQILFSYPVEVLVDVIMALKRQIPQNVRARGHPQMTDDRYLVEENPPIGKQSFLQLLRP
ncbi:hypothetical protein ACHAPC_009851 [Botrytis cinerea]|uniref:BTB domain-containing protein n=1 Tax=Botryotinia fuckeliana (strain BcDW1) TaxID=1290391 RepID=M7U1M8_BOTF1|nr:hypothetical protein BcDW1_3918 [Botrytis cinerea BcDW1]